MLWGEELVQVYNDAFTSMIADEHPSALGQPTHECWPEISRVTKELYSPVMAGDTVRDHDASYSLMLHGRLEDRWFDQSLSPLRDDQGAIGGILSVAIDRTDAVLDARRLRTLNALATGVDMRECLVRLPSVNWQVDAARDGEEALMIAHRRVPDLVLADSVMPAFGGSDLLQNMRRDPSLRETPVVLLTAHAGEESAIEGLIAGAEDYLAKPFSARELVARVGAQLEIALIRRRSENRLAALIDASWDVVYRMSPDWTEMRRLDGHGFIADTEQPSTSWLDEYIHPDDQPHVLEAIRRAIEDKAVFELEHRVRRPDGTLGWTLSRAIPLLDDDGEIIEWVGAARDVTARRENARAPETAATQRPEKLASESPRVS